MCAYVVWMQTGPKIGRCIRKTGLSGVSVTEIALHLCLDLCCAVCKAKGSVTNVNQLAFIDVLLCLDLCRAVFKAKGSVMNVN